MRDATDTQTKAGAMLRTAIVPRIEALLEKPLNRGQLLVLDFGAGRHARHADYIRAHFPSVSTYAYDPLKGGDDEAWRPGEVSNQLPPHNFDLVFSTYVLNVVPVTVENEILAQCARYRNVVHVVRDDLRQVAQRYARKGGSSVALARCGFTTRRGMQREPDLSKKGYRIDTATSKTGRWKTWVKQGNTG